MSLRAVPVKPHPIGSTVNLTLCPAGCNQLPIIFWRGGQHIHQHDAGGNVGQQEIEVDFSKPVTAPGTRAYPPDVELPGVEDDETGAGSDFWVWDCVLPDSAGQTHNVPTPMDITNPGLAIGTSLAAQLHWRVRGETDHQQVEIKVGESRISVDRLWADSEVLQLLDKSQIYTATSCIGTDETWAYAMLIGVDSAQRFLQIWQRYLMPLGYPMPELGFTARDEGWRVEIGSEFPFTQTVPVDEEGLTFTALWREHRENMIEILPKLAGALRWHLRGSAEL